MQLKPGTKLQEGKYEIIRPLGQGGFGITYEADQVMMDRRVCIKEFFIKEYCDRDEATSQVSLGSSGNAEMVRQYKAKFLKEARTIARLSHPNIIGIHDIFEENNTAYYVMEFLPGKSLNERVKESGAIPEEEALRYIRQIGGALSYAHENHVMHLDVKPSNIMLDGDRAVLIDFGLSKQYSAGGEQTSSTPVGISHGYAPLEQYREDGVREFSPQTDVYSLGATLYKLVTGETPPPAPDVVQSGIPALPPEVSPSVRGAIERAMSVRMADRPKDVKAFLALLDSAVPNDSVEKEEVTVIRKPARDKTQNQTAKADSVAPSQADGQLAPLTIGYLAIGLFIGAILTVLFVFLGLMKDDPAVLRLFRLAAIGVILAEAGLILLLRKKKIGFWMFVAGGIAGVVFGWFGTNIIGDNLFSGSNVLPKYLIALVVLDAVTLLILQIKNKHGERGWKLLTGTIVNGTKTSRLWALIAGLATAVVSLVVIFSGANTKTPSQSGEINGHGYVDLGLPSGLMWATCNVGADSPMDYGDYYAWGETETKDYYDLENYSYKPKTGRLPLSNDVAYQKWGESWRMPTEEEMHELMRCCDWYYTIIRGVRGTIVISRTNKNWLFFPAGGLYMEDAVSELGKAARIRSAGSDEASSGSQPAIFALDKTNDIMYYAAYWGSNVRPVTTLGKN